MSGTLISLSAVPISAVLWGLFRILLPLLLVHINFLVIPVEEENLRGVFGEAYKAYGARVGRWL